MPTNEVNQESTVAPSAARRLAESRRLVDLEKVDFAAIFALAKPLSKTANRLAAWEHDGLIGHAGADMLRQMGEQWRTLEPVLAEAGLADRQTTWLVTNKRRETAASALRDLACDVGKGNLGHDVFAKRLDVAVELLEELLAAPSRETPLNFDDLDITTFRQKARALVPCIQDYTDLPMAEWKKVRGEASAAKKALRAPSTTMRSFF